MILYERHDVSNQLQIICSTDCSGYHRRKHQSSASLAIDEVTDGFSLLRANNEKRVSMVNSSCYRSIFPIADLFVSCPRVRPHGLQWLQRPPWGRWTDMRPPGGPGGDFVGMGAKWEDSSNGCRATYRAGLIPFSVPHCEIRGTHYQRINYTFEHILTLKHIVATRVLIVFQMC